MKIEERLSLIFKPIFLKSCWTTNPCNCVCSTLQVEISSTFYKKHLRQYPFAKTISFCQKVKKPNSYQKKAAQFTFVKKRPHQMLTKLRPVGNFINMLIRSLYVHRSQKRKKDSHVISVFLRFWDFTYNLRAPFLYKSILHSCYLLTVWTYNFVAKEY